MTIHELLLHLLLDLTYNNDPCNRNISSLIDLVQLSPKSDALTDIPTLKLCFKEPNAPKS